MPQEGKKQRFMKVKPSLESERGQPYTTVIIIVIIVLVIIITVKIHCVL